jgi:peptidoglycan/LPS O-acetylase OafA/YrhL
VTPDDPKPLTDLSAAGHSGHIDQLDGLRGLAVLLVLMGHAANPFLNIPFCQDVLNRYSFLGVQIFFVLSGFLITGILLKAKGRERYFSTFLMRRGLRIYPLYYAVLFFVMISPSIHKHGVHWWPYLLYVSNLFVKGIQPAPLKAVWSLAVEEQFYLVWPIVVWAFSRKQIERVCIGLVVGSILLRLTGHIQFHNTLLQLDALGAGAWIACRRDLLTKLRRYARPVACFMPLGYAAIHSYELNAVTQTVEVITSAALLIVILDSRSYVAKLLKFQPLRYVGKVSYGIYLLHAMVFGIFTKLSFYPAMMMGTSIPKFFALMVIESAAVVMVASASYYLLERPFLMLKERFTVGAKRSAETTTLAGMEIAAPAIPQ